jgi:hypothetical protein
MFELIRNTQKKQEAQRCQAWCFLFLYLECLFLTNLDEVLFPYAPYIRLFLTNLDEVLFPYAPYIRLFIHQRQHVYGSYCFQYKVSKWGHSPKS